MRRLPLTFVIATIMIVLTTFCIRPEHDTEKIRVVILTDMIHDSGNSLIRILYYAPCYVLKGMIFE